MGFKKGQPRPSNAGRKKGSLNKNKNLVREVLETKGINVIDEILDILPQLMPDEKAKTLIALLPYCYPKLSLVEVNANVSNEQRLLEGASNAELDTILGEASPVHQ